MWLQALAILFLAVTVHGTHHHERTRFHRSLGTDEKHQLRNNNGEPSTFTDHETRYIAYKDPQQATCYLEKISDDVTKRKDFWKNINKDSRQKIWYASSTSITTVEARRRAGGKIAGFCQDLTIILLQETRLIPGQALDPFYNEIPADENDVVRERVTDVILTPLIERAKREIMLENHEKLNTALVGRTKRQASYGGGKSLTQTQSQYLNLGVAGQTEGKAEADATDHSSRAVVSGSNGMGQAQSMSAGGDGCDGCPGYSHFSTGGDPATYIRPTGMEVPGTIYPGSGYPRGVQQGGTGRGTTEGHVVQHGSSRVAEREEGGVTYPWNIQPPRGRMKPADGVYPESATHSEVLPRNEAFYPGAASSTGMRPGMGLPGHAAYARNGPSYPGSKPDGETTYSRVQQSGGEIYPGGPQVRGEGYPGVQHGRGAGYPGAQQGAGARYPEGQYGGETLLPGGPQSRGTTYPRGQQAEGATYPRNQQGRETTYPSMQPGEGAPYPGGQQIGGTTYHGVQQGGESTYFGVQQGGRATHPDLHQGGGLTYPEGQQRGGTTYLRVQHGGETTYPGTQQSDGISYPGVQRPGNVYPVEAHLPGGSSEVSTYTGSAIPGGAASDDSTGTSTYPSGTGPGGGTANYPDVATPRATGGRSYSGGGLGGVITTYPGGVFPADGAIGTGTATYPGGTKPGGERVTYPTGLITGGMGAPTYLGERSGKETSTYLGGVISAGGGAGTGTYPGSVDPRGGSTGTHPVGIVPEGRGAGTSTYSGGVVPTGTGTRIHSGGVISGGASKGPYSGGVTAGGAGTSSYPSGVVPGGAGAGIHPGPSGGSAVIRPGSGGINVDGQYPGGSAVGALGSGPRGSGASEYYVKQGLTPSSLDHNADSHALSSVKQTDSGTLASASADGTFGSGTAQSQVSGTYAGRGSFSAQAGTSDGNKGAQTQVSGGKEGAISSAQGTGGQGKSQTQVQLNPEDGATSTGAQTSGWNHGTNSQVQASVKGGMADAQANGEGSTSSQAQIGFQPNDGSNDRVEPSGSPFHGGGTASAQSGTYRGQSQSQLQGSFQYGITYSGAAQAGSGSGAATFRKPFNFSSIDTELFKTFKRYKAPQIPNSKEQVIPDDTDPTRQSNLGLMGSASARRTVIAKQVPMRAERTTAKSWQADHVYDSPGNDDYEEYDAEEDYDNESPPDRDARQTQSIHLDNPDEKHDIGVSRDSTMPREGDVLDSGASFPGYKIPPGFRGRVTAVSGDHTVTRNSENSQAQPVSLAPSIKSPAAETRALRKGQERNSYPRADANRNFAQRHNAARNTQPVSSSLLRSMPSKPVKQNYYTITNSVAGKIDDPRREYEHRYYTKSSTCGYFTFSCNIVHGSNGRTKICKPKVPTYSDGTPMKC